VPDEHAARVDQIAQLEVGGFERDEVAGGGGCVEVALFGVWCCLKEEEEEESRGGC
jgi:hypothetical protein